MFYQFHELLLLSSEHTYNSFDIFLPKKLFGFFKQHFFGYLVGESFANIRLIFMTSIIGNNSGSPKILFPPYSTVVMG